MSENEHYKEVAELLRTGKVVASIDACTSKAFSLLGVVSASHKFGIYDLMQWGELLSARYKGLLRRNVLCGGFEETILALSTHGDPVDLITLNSNQYVSMFLFGRGAGRLIGAFYIERDPDAILPWHVNVLAITR